MRYQDVWIVVPAFNEASVIGDVVADIRSVFDHVVLVDDGSKDNTGDIALRAGAHVVPHPVNLGQGAAIQTGVEYARSQPGAQVFATFDADGQHAHNGLRVFNKKVADGLNITMSGMSHASEFITLAVENGWRVAEEPVEILYTEYSKSKGQPLLNGVNIVFDGLLRGRLSR